MDLYKNITKPKIKVGNEFVSKGMNVKQCDYSIGALAKSLFDRLFKYLVTICNKTLATGQKRATFIGVLDIAGFEIFDVSYMFICITICMTSDKIVLENLLLFFVKVMNSSTIVIIYLDYIS